MNDFENAINSIKTKCYETLDEQREKVAAAMVDAINEHLACHLKTDNLAETLDNLTAQLRKIDHAEDVLDDSIYLIEQYVLD